MNIFEQTNIKAIYRVTGTPENFLTALRFKIWGFNQDNQNHWKKLLPGDIIFFHSKGSDSKFITRSKSGVIGFGVVGNNFFMDNTHLWIDEKIDGKSYPYRFSFSEIYLFSAIPISDDWDSTILDKYEITKQIVQRLVDSAIPLGELDGFPHMGSYSAILNPAVKRHLLVSARKLNFYGGAKDEDFMSKSAGLKVITNEQEALRYATTLTVFDDIKERIVSEHRAEYSVNTKDLARAEKSHFNVVSYLLSFFLNKDYNVLCNNHVDLFAYKNNNAFLVEAKSIENKNFIRQSRKGIVQLFEYNYFEISRFKRDEELSFTREYSLLATSDEPKDLEYVKFVNSLKIKTLAIKNNTIIKYGESIDLNHI